MSWIRFSKGITLLAVLALTVVAVGTGAAVTIDTDAPSEAQAGDVTSVTVTVSDVYEDADQWTLTGSTGLVDVQGWEVTKVTPSGEAETSTFDGKTFEVPIESGENLDRISVTITGTVPEVESFSYDPPQTFDAVTLTREGGGDVAEIETASIHHYTSDSADARSTLDDARTAVENADSDEAQNRLDTAISAFEDGSFDAAQTGAKDAKNTAESAESSAQTIQYVLYGVGAIVVLALIGGGFYYYRSQQDDYDKLG
ncbi:DUF4398 domain-containing protein [Halorhabdus rudnickae]|uniref:DUF4398 domain-containing protein n=1 Tax=Halorhabdus rudnickae TaxID=1775544 RepID=UPI001082C8E8|nr:DUF4398 domain-containing protein [Halorhabdus rudnickae]